MLCRGNVEHVIKGSYIPNQNFTSKDKKNVDHSKRPLHTISITIIDRVRVESAVVAYCTHLLVKF